MNCQDGRYNCGIKTPSSCVPYTGATLTSFDPSSLDRCDTNINDIIEKIDAIIKALQDATNISLIDNKCLNFNPETATQFDLNQLVVTEICAIKAQLQTLQDQFNSFNILNQPINIDLSCLYGSNNCTPQQETVGSVILALVAEVCSLKSQINN